MTLDQVFADSRRLMCHDGGVPLGNKNPRTAFLNIPLAPEVGIGRVDAVAFNDDFLALSMKARFYHTVNYKLAADGWTRLHFRTAARTSMLFDGLGQSDLEGPLCQVLHQPDGLVDGERIESNVDLNWLTLFIRPRMLAERLQLDNCRAVPQVRRLASGGTDFTIHNQSISARMLRAMNDLFDSDYSGDLRAIHLEAKAMELMCMMAQGLMEESDADLPPIRLTNRDRDRLHEARAILDQEYVDPPSVASLSRRLGLNRNKLTYGFKHLHGLTLTDYCLDRRLDAALRMLENGGVSVQDVSDKVGYAQITSFSAAFRRKYGFSPRQCMAGARRL